jgi:SAM-dependent methyltransferase
VRTTREAYALLRRHYRPPGPAARAYGVARLAILPVPWVADLLGGLRGTVLCLGCGFGILETVLAAANPQLEFVASDFDARRIAAARAAVRDLPNIRFEVADATSAGLAGSYDNVFFSDLLHHLPAGEQEALLERVWAVVRPGGSLVVKDVDVRPRWKYWWNYAHDRAMAGPPLTYLPRQHYRDVLTELGAEVTESLPATRLPYAHYAITGKRPPAQAPEPAAMDARSAAPVVLGTVR